MKLYQIVAIGMVVVFIASFFVIFIIDKLNKISKLCEKDKTLKVCQTNTFAVAVITMLVIAAGLVIVIATVAYILIASASSMHGENKWT